MLLASEIGSELVCCLGRQDVSTPDKSSVTIQFCAICLTSAVHDCAIVEELSWVRCNTIDDDAVKYEVFRSRRYVAKHS